MISWISTGKSWDQLKCPYCEHYGDVPHAHNRNGNLCPGSPVHKKFRPELEVLIGIALLALFAVITTGNAIIVGTYIGCLGIATAVSFR